MNMTNPSFANDWQIRELLDISKSQLDAIDRSRLPDGRVIGLDNFAKLKISMVFAALAIESALNHFIQIHSLLPREPYLQTFIAEVSNRFLWARTDQKLSLLKKCWSSPFPENMISDVTRLIEIRNKVVHEKGRIEFVDARSHGVRALSQTIL
jgi:hypothetical protein